MSTEFGTGIAASDDGYDAGRAAARAAVDELDADRVDFCQVFSSTRYDYGEALAAIRDVVGEDAELIGCSSYGEFTDEGVTNDGLVVSVVSSDSMTFHTGLGEGVSEDPHGAVRDAVNELPPELSDEYPYASAINLHNGMVGVSEQLALMTQRKLGPHVSMAGGSASDDDYALDTVHVFRDDEVSDDGVVLALLGSKRRPVITVNHGHEPISDALEVTDSEGGVVREFNGQPAYEVWTEAVADLARERHDLDVEEFDDPNDQQLQMLAAMYEFAIDQGDSYKIRAFMPEDLQEGSLGFFVEVPEGTVMRVMQSTPEDVVESGWGAVEEAFDHVDEDEVAGAFVYECSCRQLILGEEFDDYIDDLGEGLEMPFAGFETYGEMCMEMGQNSGFHNTTAVFMLLPE